MPFINDNNKQITDNNNKDSNSLDYSLLTTKNKLFIEYLLNGMKTIDAYHKAGYNASESSAYEMRHRLKPFIQELSGLSDVELFKELRELSSLRVTEIENNETISAKDKLEIIKTKAKLLKLDQESNKPKQITPFIINHYHNDKGDKTINKDNVIDIDNDNDH